MSTVSCDFIDHLKALAVAAQDAHATLLRGPLPSPHEQGVLNRIIERFEYAARPAVVLELIARNEDLQALSDRACETVEKMNNQAIAMEKLVAEPLEKLASFNGGRKQARQHEGAEGDAI